MLKKTVNKTALLVEGIIHHAGILFRRHGYRNTKISDITAALKISRKTVYEVCSSKEDILNDVLWNSTKAGWDVYKSTISEWIPPDEMLLSFIRYVFNDSIERNIKGSFWGLYSEDSTIYAASCAQMKRLFINILSEASSAGLLKQTVDPVYTSDCVMTIVRTALMHTRIRDDRYTLFNEALAMIADSAGFLHRPEFGGFKIDYYRVLGVAADASQTDIKKAYRARMKEHHPDVSAHANKSDRANVNAQENVSARADADVRAEGDASAHADTYVRDQRDANVSDQEDKNARDQTDVSVRGNANAQEDVSVKANVRDQGDVSVQRDVRAQENNSDSWFFSIRKAYEILGDTEKRSRYDAFLRSRFSGRSLSYAWDEYDVET